MLLHGYTDCPAQYAGLAQVFYARGYNVWVPRAPRHGVLDSRAHAGLTVDELLGYADGATDIGTGLGADLGVTGISGGAVLATWLATHRSGDVHHLLALSPFYRPAAAQAPGFAVKPIIVLYGSRIVPDHFTGNGFSFAALSQYLRIARNVDAGTTGATLTTVAVVTSANDGFIDRDTAVDVTRRIAERSGVTPGVSEIPRETGVGHDIVDPAGLGRRADEFARLYADLYEGRH